MKPPPKKKAPRPTLRATPPPSPPLYDPAHLAQIRANIGKLGSRAHEALAALDGDAPHVLEAVANLARSDRTTGENTVTMLLFASYSARPDVRVVALQAMKRQRYKVIEERIEELLKDPELTVRAAAKEVQEFQDNVTPPCLECGRTGYELTEAVKLEPSSDPHATYVRWPVFCSKDCAVTYALDVVRAQFDRDAIHECDPTEKHEAGAASDCTACIGALYVGRPENWEPPWKLPTG